MYKLSRAMLILSLALVLLGMGIVVRSAPSGIWAALLIIAFLLFIRPRKRPLTTLGSARLAEERDLRRAGCVGANSGLLLGRITSRRKRLSGTLGLINPWVSSSAACGNFFGGLLGKPAPIVRLPQAVHCAVFAPSGAGKGVSCVIPFLLTTDESAVIIDFKGELARATAEHRRREFGHRVVLLDPYCQVTRSPDCFNPLAFIDKHSARAIDECNDLANALVVRTGEEKEPHWNDSAELWIAALLATIVYYGEPENGTRSLQTVRELATNPQKLELAIKLMQESAAWGGMLARMGGQLAQFVDKEKSSTLTTVSRHLRFLDTPAIAANTRGSSFDPAALRSGKMTIYLVLPPDHLRAQSGLLRMWIGSLLSSAIGGGLQEASKVHFILDEAAALGHLDAIDDAVDKYRGYGVRLQMYYQSVGQLKRCFPNGQDQTLLSSTTQMFFGVNDQSTAEYVSSRIGDETIVVESGGRSWGTSHQRSQDAVNSGSVSCSDTLSANWQQQARRLLKPEEVMMLPQRAAITFAAGLPPICTVLLRYYEEPSLGKRPSTLARAVRACGTLCGACLLLLVAFIVLTVGFIIAHPEAVSQ